MKKFIYRVQWGEFHAMCQTGTDLDKCIGSVLKRGASVEELKISLEEILS